VQRQYLGDEARELAMEETGETRLVSLRGSAALHINGAVTRRHAEDRRPPLYVKGFDGRDDRDVQRTTCLTRPVLGLGGESFGVDP